MKRKGFTLIELIAVIVVLAIIALIATPLIMNQMENTKKEAYKASVQSVFDGINTYLAQNAEIEDIPSTGILIPEHEIYQQLDLKNANFISGKIYRDENGILKVESISDGKYCASGSKNELRVTKGACALLDVTAPTVKILRSYVTSSSITIAVNAEDLESGIVKYKYYLDGEFKAEKRNNVYTFKGLERNREYTVKVIVENGNGKTAEATEMIKTNDREIEFKETPENEWSHSKTVTITYPKEIGTEVYQYQIVGKTDWITVAGSTVDVLLDNPATITARILQEGKTILSNIKVIAKIDNEPPEIKSIDGNEGWSTSKQLTINAIDRGSGVKDYSFDGGKTWQTSNKSKVFTSEETVQIAVRDKLGNVSEVRTVTIQKIDTTIVTAATIKAITVSDNKDYTSNSWTNKTVRLTAKATPENAPSGYTYTWYKKAGNAYVEIGNGSYIDIKQEQTNTYKVEIRTIAGSAPKSSSDFTVKIDKTAPTCPTAPWSGESTIWATSRTIKATCTDTGGSGCTSATASKTWTFTDTTETANRTYDMEDNAGNSTSCNRQTINVYVDKTGPTINRKSTTASTNSIGVNFEVTDNESGVKTDSYSCMFGTSVNEINKPGTIKNGACTITGVNSGTRYYYRITAQDELGNGTTTKAAYVDTRSIQGATFSYPDNNGSSYTKSKRVTINYNGTGITSPVYFFKYSGTSNINNSGLKRCSTSNISVPKSASECTTVVAAGQLAANTWYMAPSSTTITVTSVGTLNTAISDGTNVNSTPQLSITKIDNEGPVLNGFDFSTTTKSVTFTYNAIDNKAGVKSVTCVVQGISSGATTSATSTGSINSCSIDGLKTGTYNYAITATDTLGNKTVKTGAFSTGNFSKCKVEIVNNKEYATQKTIKITGITAGAQLQYKIGSSGSWTNTSNGYTFNLTSNNTVYCQLTDGTNADGNHTTITGIDRSTPQVYISALSDSVQNIAYSEGTWTRTMVQLTANPSNSSSGYASYQWYTVTDKSGTYKYNKISGATGQKYTIQNDTNTLYVVTVTNKAGTTSSYSTPFRVKRDATAPSKPTYSAAKANCSGATGCTYTSGSWAPGNVYVYLKSTDSGSRISKIQWSYDNKTWNDLTTSVSGSEANATDTNSVTAGTNRNFTAYYRAIDNAGNASASNSINVKIDGCEQMSWSHTNWSNTCSKTCGGGVQTGTDYYTGVSGKICATALVSRSCNTQACPSGTRSSGTGSSVPSVPSLSRSINLGEIRYCYSVPTGKRCGKLQIRSSSNGTYHIYSNAMLYQISCAGANRNSSVAFSALDPGYTCDDYTSFGYVKGDYVK